MGEYRLATRYARSLIELAQEQKQLEQVNRDLHLLNNTVKASRELLLMLRNPIIHADKKIKIIEQIFGSKLESNITLSFLRLVVKKSRESYLPAVAQTFIAQYNKLKKVLPVTLTTAVPVNEELVNRIKQLVHSKTGFSNIELETKVNPRIIGGYILQYEDQLYNASVRRHLEVLDDNFLSNIYVKQV